jgi:HEAT repeat protein
MMKTLGTVALLALASTLAGAGFTEGGQRPPAKTRASAKPAPAAAAAAVADPVQAMLEQKALRAAYNPVLLSFLTEEGRPRLSEAQRQEALEQLVAGFRSEIDIKPGAQVAAGLATAVGLLAGGTVGEGISAGAYAVWRDWVDAAMVLAQAGYKAEATQFFEHCLVTFPDDDLRERCAVGLAASDPERGYGVLMGLLDGKHTLDEENVALRLLGVMAGAPGCPPAKKDAVVEQLLKKSSGLMNASHEEAVVFGFARSGDPRAVEPLRKMTKGLRADATKHAALRALVLAFKDAEATDELLKKLKKGDDDRFFATTVLLAAGQQAGFDAALQELTKKKKGMFGKLTSTGDQKDYSAELVAAVVDAGGDKAKAVLAQVLPARKPDEWITASIAIGLLELGDASAAPVVRLALAREDWPFTRLQAAVALAGSGDLSGIPVLKAMAQTQSGLKGLGEALLGKRKADPESLRGAVAEALGRIDRAEAVPVLTALLDDRAPTVRLSAAYALAGMKNPAALEGLAKALGVDYGKHENRSRNPEVHAHLVRAAARFSGDPRAQGILAEAGRSTHASVRFLALVAAKS